MIARPGRAVGRFNRWAIQRGFPLLAWIAPRAPRGVLFFHARWVIALVMAIYPAPKRAIARNLARLLGAPPDSRRVRRAVREMLHHFAYSWVDLFRFGQLPAARLVELLDGADLSALEPLRRARDEGRRQILVTAHLGNWELGGVLASQAGLPLAVVYVPDAFGEAERFRGRFRAAGDVTEIPLDLDDRLAGLPVLRAFDAGRVVALQGDRDFNDRGVAVPFLGAPARLPLGPFLLARMTGATLVPVFVAYTPELRITVELGAPIAVARTEDRARDAREALELWLEVLAGALRRWPTQWYTFYDYWLPEGEQEAPGAG